jgi:Protein of unknown function (DUF3088)
MARDHLILLEAGFTDPTHPGETFICPDGNQVEGFLAVYPERAKNIDVDRVGFSKPRAIVTDLLGPDNQSLPVLILGGDAPADAAHANGHAFVTDTRRILALLHERHGFPKLH